MTLTACPDPGRLRELLADDLPGDEGARLGGHVAECLHCQQTLDHLTAESGDLAERAKDVHRNPPTPEPALLRVISELGSLPETEDAPAGEEVSLDFLQPPRQPGHLGRLGHYEVLDILNRGGMGIVLKAHDPALQRLVAIKVLAPPLASSAASRRRILREAQAAAAIKHDHVVTLHAVEEADGLPYLVMEYLPGRSLQQRLDAGEVFAAGEVVRLGRQIAAGLAAAHALGLIHRDIKPANIMLEQAGLDLSPQVCALPRRPDLERVKITDFGLARAIDDASLSQLGVVAGTPLYMAPEQFSGGPVDHRADLYSLGVLLYRLAAGREPFTGPTVANLMAQHVFERPPALAEVAPGRVPGWLEQLILRLLHKDPATRPQTAEEVIQFLEHAPPDVPLPADEGARLEALRRYKILDTDPEQGFDDLAALASYVCGTPLALITLVDEDRQWFKARVGLSLRETSRNVSFCTHTILKADPLVVRDALTDERFVNSTLVRCDPHVRFYAGIPLVTLDGHALGALCVMDRVPRELTPDQMSALAALSRLVLTQLELRRNLLELRDAIGNRAPAPPAE